MELEAIRDRIDAIDAQLVALFVERMETVRSVAAYKAENHMPILDSARERQVLLRAAARSTPELERYTRLLFSTLMDVSRTHQRALLNAPSALAERIAGARREAFPTTATIACQGTEGAYSQQACDALFPLANIVYFVEFESVFEAVEKGLCQYGVLPVENSIAGSVTQVYDLMDRHQFAIVRSVCQRIDHVLMGLPGASPSQLRTVHSHPQALTQCGGFFRKHPQLTAQPSANTAVAAKQVASAGDMTQAVIASRVCAGLYGLTVLEDSVADDESNHTRFVCIGKAMEIYPGASRIGLSLTLPHKPGALYGLMSRFAAMDINLTKLESRPIPGRAFEFGFHLELEVPALDSEVINLLTEIEQTAERFQFLGCWREA